MAPAGVRERAWRRTRKVGRGVREFVVEAVGEALLTAAACLALAVLLGLSVWGWQRSPLLTGGLAGILVVFLSYGAWELFRPAGAPRKGRLAAVAAGTTAVVVVVGFYASSCSCG